ncbi:hypothetical protein NDU88_006692 [Pleurodeles waltl]|uniref:Uncharacterized protein n=1 Tax=Pleurodeles waltl TaxID=8319 RepID=A0AAV7MCZ1_PLEWA|nr:hypothetical protein NDU88_006692 [Pleurodeles waltl]
MAPAPWGSTDPPLWSRDLGVLIGASGARRRANRGETLCAGKTQLWSGIRPLACDPEETGDQGEWLPATAFLCHGSAIWFQSFYRLHEYIPIQLKAEDIFEMGGIGGRDLCLCVFRGVCLLKEERYDGL